MKHSDKNRDPERAKKRAVADARCALRKLGLLSWLDELTEDSRDDGDPRRIAEAFRFVRALGSTLISGDEQ